MAITETKSMKIFDDPRKRLDVKCQEYRLRRRRWNT